MDATVADTDHSKQLKDLQQRIEGLEAENARLRSMVSSDREVKDAENNGDDILDLPATGSRLSRKQIERYSRQLLLHGGFGVEGQLKLLSSSVLVVGAGGIGSTGKKGVNCREVKLINSETNASAYFSNPIFGCVWGG
jgi:hypothetical protein